MDIRIFGESLIDEPTRQQLINCMTEDSIGVLTADAHRGYSHPIGGAIAYKNKISVSGVGFDIACGNMAVMTDVKVSDVNIPKVMDEIFKRISFGVGRPNDEPIDHPVFDHIANSEFKPQRKLIDLARKQLGTVGSGNHYVDLFEGSEGELWIGVHFGSRGFGHKTATGFIAMSQGLTFEDKGKEGSIDSKPILFDMDSKIGQDYYHAKGNTLLNYAGINTDIIDFIADETSEKIGKFSPGTGIPIVNKYEIEKQKPDYIVVLSWNFLCEIKEKLRKHGYKGKFIIPIPAFEIVE